jgi:hypothetical protein
VIPSPDTDNLRHGDNGMDGFAYVFLRRDGAPLPPGCGGHVGWGFLTADDGVCYFGSTENTSGEPVVIPGHDNGWWGQEGDQSAMFAAMKKRNYDGYKKAVVHDCDPAAARAAADATRLAGYFFIRGNCLDHAWQVIYGYGMKGLPWRENHPSPNDWFALYNGEYQNL